MGVARSLCLAILLLALGSSAHAQSPRAGAPAPGDGGGSRVAVDVGVTGNLSRGLVYRDLVTNRGVLQLWEGPWGFYLQPYWLYSRIGTAAGRVTADNDIYVRAGVFRNLTRSAFAFAVNVYDHSLRRRVAHRDLFGGGVGMNFVERKPVTFAASIGVLGEVADYDGSPLLIEDGAPAEPTESRTVLRGAFRIHGKYRLGGGRLAVIHDLIVTPALRDPTYDYRVALSGSIDAPIAKGVSARAQIDATREGVIVEGTKRNALVISFGVSYRGEWRREAPAQPPESAAPAQPPQQPAQPAAPTPPTTSPSPAPASPAPTPSAPAPG
jgi:hypothetical protein